MSVSEIFILSAALSADAIGIGASCRLKGIRMSLLSKTAIAVMSFLITGAAVMAGSCLSNIITVEIADIAGAVLLLIIGIYIITGSDGEGEASENAVEKTAGILRYPDHGDMDGSRNIELGEALCIGAAISADSAAAGIGMSEAGLLLPAFCGVIQFLFLCIGERSADYFRRKFSGREKIFTTASGIIIIVTGLMKISGGI